MNINTYSKYSLAALGALSLNSHSAFSKDPQKPNIIVIFCDDLGYGDLSCYGHPTIHTPNIDRMAAEGQKWTSFYVSSSVSSPSRAGLLTGRSGVRTGLYGDKLGVFFPHSAKGFSDSGEKTIASKLQQGGYTTALIGKWHLGHREKDMPWNFGFERFWGTPFSNDMSRKEQLLMNPRSGYNHRLPIYDQDSIVEWEPDQNYFTQRITQKSIEFIEQNRRDPFFLYIAQPMPHLPVYASPDFRGKSPRGLYGDSVEELDWSVGEILKALKENKLDKNTLVIFTSDNGPWLECGHDGGSAGHLRKGKGTPYEGGFRVPCVMWGEMLEPAVIRDMASTLDLFPTFVEMAGMELDGGIVYDGESLMEVFTKAKDGPREEFFYYIGSTLCAYRKGEYKIHVKANPSGYATKAERENFTLQLYNIDYDPEERYNIAEANPQIVEQMLEDIKQHQRHMPVALSVFDSVVQ